MTFRGGKRLALTAPWLLAATLLAPAAGGKPPDPLFADGSPLALTLELPLAQLLDERKARPEVAGVAVVPGPTGAPVKLDVAISTRGHNRLATCAFPPLSLDFKRSQLDGTVFAGQNKLKLATLCRDSASYEQYLELERLAYLMYQQVSDVALRVRAARVRYVDTERQGSAREAPAFFLEHFDSIAARTGRVVLEVPALQLSDLDPPTLALIGLFEFLIGNTDWSATAAAEGRDCCHNVVPLAPAGGTGPVVPFPYDFDSSGFVDAAYAKPNERLNIMSVRVRVYRGFCASNPLLEGARDRLNAARPAIEAVIESGRLEAKARRKAQEYIAQGYARINDPRDWQRDILERCRGE